MPNLAQEMQWAVREPCGHKGSQRADPSWARAVPETRAGDRPSQGSRSLGTLRNRLLWDSRGD